MKALPKRKGNSDADPEWSHYHQCLDESPSKKKGKSVDVDLCKVFVAASMKITTKR